MYLPDSIIGNFAAVILLLVILLLARKNRFFRSLFERINSDEKFYRKIRNIILSAIFLFCFFWVVSSQFIPSGDQIAVQNSAFLFEIGQYDPFSPGAYLLHFYFLGISRCPIAIESAIWYNNEQQYKAVPSLENPVYG